MHVWRGALLMVTYVLFTDMALTRAEIQKNYRERQKKKNGQFLKKERARQKRNYVPVNCLTDSERKKCNMKTKQRVHKHRLKKRDNAALRPEQIVSESGYETVGSSGLGPLIVKLPNARRNGPRKRLSKALRNANTSLKELKLENEILKRKVKTTQRKMQRIKKSNTPMTPKSKTESMMKNAGIRKGKGDRVRKQLLMSNVISAEMADKVKVKSLQMKRRVYGTVVGNLLLKYRCMSRLGKSAKLNRNLMSNVIKRGVYTTKTRKRLIYLHKEKVIDFLEREDNCRVQPGKNDAVKCDEGKKQTRVLTDYLENLYDKFCSENIDLNISFSTFKRIRPRYILRTTFLSRSTCLCTKHQNFAFKLKMLKNEGIVTTMNPDEFIRQNTIVEEDKLPERISYSVWKRVTMKDGKKKMKIVKEEMERQAFFKIWEKDTEEFRNHVGRVQKQYSEIRKLKEALPEHEVIIQMDFAENYACKTADEIQSAYWNQSSVTLHPMVVYFRDENTFTLKHKSYVAVSDTMTHASSSVLAILDKFYSLKTPETNNITHVHYWTDSPSSQYRNRYIFEALLNHKETYGCNATWNYFEAGHGKGPCDGVGGTTKRMADESVNAQKSTIQDADDFYNWAKRSGIKGMEYFFVRKEDVDMKAEDLKNYRLKPVKGTMALHACKTDHSLLLTGNTSCYCDDCIKHTSCEHWSIVPATGIPRKEQGSNNQTIPSNETETPEQDIGAQAADSGYENDEQGTATTRGDPSLQTDNEQDVQADASASYNTDDFVAAMYGDKWFVGKIIDLDEEDAEISFMVQKKDLFQWPSAADIIWVKTSNILCVIKAPTPSGKSRRMFKVDKDDISSVEHEFELHTRK